MDTKIRKEWFIIESQEIERTEKMEQAFRHAHGYGISEYQNDPEKIVEVEQRREREYAKSQKIVSQLERQVHRDI